jgi:hypothetical protein
LKYKKKDTNQAVAFGVKIYIDEDSIKRFEVRVSLRRTLDQRQELMRVVVQKELKEDMVDGDDEESDIDEDLFLNGEVCHVYPLSHNTS